MMNGTDQKSQTVETANQPACALLVFRIADQAFAFPIETVTQLIHMLRLTPIPQADEQILGVANIRGRMISVFSARRRLGLPDGETGLYTPVILTQSGESQAGWVVDEVTDVIRVPAGQVTRPEDTLPAGCAEAQAIYGLVNAQGPTILVLDPQVLLHSAAWRTIQRTLDLFQKPANVEASPRKTPQPENGQARKSKASSAAVPNLARRSQKARRKMKAVLTDPFAALAPEILQADPPSGSHSNAGTETSGA